MSEKLNDRREADVQLVQPYMNRIKALEAKLEAIEQGLTQILEHELETCNRCDGSGNIYADGKVHYMHENSPTRACPVCNGRGETITDTGEIAAAVLVAAAQRE